ncbi:hypothetical protein C2G38_2045484 [Gigaspora rosea]|uniref:Uncharacterized protein n=1 Tax=Gigaspora rosea TaxID=44941 RepID=A0A397UCY3_9GLOM|nr:hypothetical protein C2G38_2045484 [Gigaspora rosea]
MPAKLFTICYVQACIERLTQEFTVKDITAIVRLSDDDPSKIIYLNIKAFIPLTENNDHYIEPFETGDVISVKGKFVGRDNYYTVSATSIKALDFDFDDMSALGINTFIIGITNQTIKNVENNISLEFYVEEKVGEKEPSNFWVETRHNVNNRYLSNKTGAINQNARSTTAILVGTIVYDVSTGKHIVVLEDITMITSNRNNSTAQSSVPPWLAQTSVPGYTRNRQPRGATPKVSKKGRSTLSNMGPTSTPPPQVKILMKSYKQIQAQPLQTQSRIYRPPTPNNYHILKVMRTRKAVFSYLSSSLS